MCGIAGFLGQPVAGLLDRMIEAIGHRGPDQTGRWVHAEGQIGHTRLSIVDLSNGDQPIARRNGSVVVSYNGEIYNYDQLRQEIEQAGECFATTCDTELLPLGYLAFGIDFVRRLNGMFAFALYDAERRELHLVRDHFGIKPLYYALVSGGLVFASTARAVALHPEVDRSLREQALRDFLQFRYVPSGCHFYRGVETLPPGHVATFRDGRLELRPFWQAPPFLNGARLGRDEWVERVDELLADSTCLQLRSDVPVGILLSGGVDSTAVAHYASSSAGRPATAFTFAVGGGDDETEPAVSVARRYGLEHVRVAMPEKDPLSGLYDAVACMDLPVGDAIILPTYRLCQAVGRELKVVLTGEGADELFGGYVHYPVLMRLARLSRQAPWARHLAALVRLLPVGLLNRAFDYRASLGRLGRDKLARILARLDYPAELPRLVSSTIDDEEILEASHLPAPSRPKAAALAPSDVLLDGMRSWLPYQILNKMDALSMAHGVEARVPFLDPRLYELLATAPLPLILGGRGGKPLLRQVMARHGAPNAARPKQAFHLPVERLYRGDLLALSRDWLCSDELRRHGILKPAFVARTAREVEAGEFLASKRLVSMICLHMWLDAHAESR